MESSFFSLNTALERFAAKQPDKTFIASRKNTFSYAEVKQYVDGLASFFVQTGVIKGDKICLMLPRTPELIITYLAATRIGALPVPVNYLLPPQTINAFIDEIEPKVLVANAKLGSILRETGSAVARSVIRIDTDGRLPHWHDWSRICVASNYSDRGFVQDDRHSVNYLNYTTGSSGKPKAAFSTNQNLYWNTRSLVEYFNITEDDIHLCMFGSFAHPHELFVRALYTGGSIVLLQEINPKTIIKTINAHEITCIMGLAPMYEAMAEHCSQMSIDSIKIVESGGMYTRQEVNQKFFKTFGKPILSVWGSTETNGVALANAPDDYLQDGAMGKPCPYYQVKLMENGREVAPGKPGEMFIKGPGVIPGYEGYPPLLDQDGWYASGDIVRQGENGFYYFMDRKSGMIKYTGLKIYPLQIELVMLKHPKIIEAAVIGVEDYKKGSAPKAYIVTLNNELISSWDIREFCKDHHLPGYMIPKDVVIVDSLPKIGSGKIDKKAIAEGMAKGNRNKKQ